MVLEKEEPKLNFKKFQMISYEFGLGQKLFQITKNFGSEEMIIADKKNRTFVKIPFDALGIFMEYLNKLYNEDEVK